MPATGFQAVILCGPGESLNPFNSNPKDFPKALIPIANRPMVWYPLDWCYSLGITNIHLVTPPESLAALEAALSQNPHLTSLPSPKPSILAPQGLTLTTGTAEIFRFKQVQDAIIGDFVVLPCDLVSELSGLSLLESWMTLQGSLGSSHSNSLLPTSLVQGGEAGGRRGGLGVWYETKDSTEEGVGVKKEETDFIVTTKLPAPIVPPASSSLRPHISNLVMAMPTAVLKDVVDEKQGLKIRPQLPRKYKKMKSLASHRDAHVYFFPYWVKEYMMQNDTFDSVSEDAIGWWAKARWQTGLEAKLGLSEILNPEQKIPEESGTLVNGDVDVASLSSTWSGNTAVTGQSSSALNGSLFASRVRNATEPEIAPPDTVQRATTPTIPPILCYTHPAQPTSPLLRRIDTVPLLLNASLLLAKIPSLTDNQGQGQGQGQGQDGRVASSRLAHVHKIPPSTTTPSQLTLHSATVLLDANVTLTPKSTIRESVIGANCVLGTPSGTGPGVRLNRCMLMDGVAVESGTVLNGCVLGRRCMVGKGCDLRDCYVQEGYVVPEGTTSKGEVFARFDEDGGQDEEEDLYNQQDPEVSLDDSAA